MSARNYDSQRTSQVSDKVDAAWNHISPLQSVKQLTHKFNEHKTI